jgi:hypothetical protein
MGTSTNSDRTDEKALAQERWFALLDGQIVDVCEHAIAAGFTRPTAVTRSLLKALHGSALVEALKQLADRYCAGSKTIGLEISSNGRSVPLAARLQAMLPDPEGSTVKYVVIGLSDDSWWNSL